MIKKNRFLIIILILIAVEPVSAQLPCWNLVVRDTPFYVGQDVYARINSVTKLNVICDLDSLDLEYQDTSTQNYERYLLGTARFPGVYQVRVIDPLCSDRRPYLDYHLLIYSTRDRSSPSSFIKPPSLSTDTGLYRQFLDTVAKRNTSFINKVLQEFVSDTTLFPVPSDSSIYNACIFFLRDDPAVIIIADSTIRGPVTELLRTRLSNAARMLSMQVVKSLELESTDLILKFSNMLTRIFTYPRYLLISTDGMFAHTQRFFGHQKSIHNKAFVGWKTHYFTQFILSFQLPKNF